MKKNIEVLEKEIEKAEYDLPYPFYTSYEKGYLDGLKRALTILKSDQENATEIREEQPKGTMQMKIKANLNKWELDQLRGGNHGGLKFIVEDDQEKVLKTIYRVTLSGGLDAANNEVDKQQKKDEIFSVSIWKRWGEKRGQWHKVAYLERQGIGLFNH